MKKLSILLAAVLTVTCLTGIAGLQTAPRAQAASVQFMEVYPDHVFEIIFEVSDNPNFVANATVQIEYDTLFHRMPPPLSKAYCTIGMGNAQDAHDRPGRDAA